MPVLPGWYHTLLAPYGAVSNPLSVVGEAGGVYDLGVHCVAGKQ